MNARLLALTLTSALALSACETMNNMGSTMNGWFSGEEEVAQVQIEEESAPATNTQSTVAKPATANCPAVEVMNDLREMVQFSDFANPVPENKISSLTIANINAQCSEEEKAIAMKIDVTFDGTLGSKGRPAGGQAANFSYPYFIAVTDKDGSILAKEIFAASLTYSKGQDTIKQIETINQLLPKSAEVATYTVLFGFQLNDNQLQYNRMQAEPAAGDITPETKTAE